MMNYLYCPIYPFTLHSGEPKPQPYSLSNKNCPPTTPYSLISQMRVNKGIREEWQGGFLVIKGIRLIHQSFNVSDDRINWTV